jgi:adenylylsulfate kinase
MTARLKIALSHGDRMERLATAPQARWSPVHPARIEPAVVWFTGLSGAGKSTIAHEVYRHLHAAHIAVEYLDGDGIRAVFPATGFTRVERDEHVRRVGFLASRLEHHGVVVICALISPYAASRLDVRQRCRRVIEVHVSTPLDECERRDVKGLYRRARRGEIRNFTGLDDAYESPEQPELRIDTTDIPRDDAVRQVLAALDSTPARTAAGSHQEQLREAKEQEEPHAVGREREHDAGSLRRIASRLRQR